MYEELIRRLREEPLDSNKAALPIMDLCIDAATAIENLSHRLDMAQGERDAATRHMIELEQDVCRLKSRLAAYEDSGLEPEEIERIVDAYGRVHTLRTESAERLEIVREIKADRLRELVQAEQDGRLVVLPCNVGDTVFQVDYMTHSEALKSGVPQSKDTYQNRKYGRKRAEYLPLIVREKKMVKSLFRAFGKTVFLTREEAEAALAQEGDSEQ